MAATATVAYPKFLHDKNPGNKKLMVGLIGCANESMNVLKVFLSNTNVECSAIFDTNEKKLSKAGNKIFCLQQKKPRLYRNLQQFIDDKSINSVIDAGITPGFSSTLLAVEAGKNTYVIENGTHDLEDYQLLLNYQKRNSNIIQLNRWQMNARHWKAAKKFIRSGRFDVQKIHVWDYSGGLYNKSSNFLMGYALECLNNKIPGSAITTSIRSGSDHPESMMTVFETENINLLWDHSVRTSNRPYGKASGVAFHTSESTVLVHPNGSEVIYNSHHGEKINKALCIARPDDAEKARFLRIRDFLNCIKETAAPRESEIENAVKTALSEKMAQISLQSGRKIFADNIMKV